MPAKKTRAIAPLSPREIYFIENLTGRKRVLCEDPKGFYNVQKEPDTGSSDHGDAEFMREIYINNPVYGYKP